MGTSTDLIDKKISDFKGAGSPGQALIKFLTFVLFVGAIVGIVYVLNTFEPAANFLDRYGHWLGEALWVFVLGLYIVLHKGTRQPPLEFVVSDDPRIMPVDELVKDEQTKLYVDCSVLSRNVYIAPSTESSKSYPYAMFSKASSKGELDEFTKSLTKNNRIETDWELIRRVDEPTGKGLLIEVFKHDRKKVYNQGSEAQTTYAIVFRGTVSLNSWMSNAHWLFKWLPFQDQYDQVKYIVPELVREIDERHPYDNAYNIIATGHSLGGGLAQHACYVSEKVKTAYVFNSSPVTGFTDIPKKQRARNSEGVKIHRLYERGEILENFRFFMKIVYLFKPTPNRNPYLSEHRFDFERAGLITEHGMLPIAIALCYLNENAKSLKDTEGKFKMIKDVMSPAAGQEAKFDAANDQVKEMVDRKKKEGRQKLKDERRRIDENNE